MIRYMTKKKTLTTFLIFLMIASGAFGILFSLVMGALIVFLDKWMSCFLHCFTVYFLSLFMFYCTADITITSAIKNPFQKYYGGNHE